jgi:hypothetical protein
MVFWSFLKHTHKMRSSSRWGRIKLIGAGVVLIGVGMALMRAAVQVVTHWTGQPMFSWGLVAAGLLCVVLAFIPISWIEKAAEIPRERAKHSRQD